MADPQVARSNNLSIQLTSFIGREREIAQVKGFLSGTRLLTLTGTGVPASPGSPSKLRRYWKIASTEYGSFMLHGRKLGTHLGVGLKTDEDRRMWRLLQDHRAMMDWIAVPNFLAA